MIRYALAIGVAVVTMNTRAIAQEDSRWVRKAIGKRCWVDLFGYRTCEPVYGYGWQRSFGYRPSYHVPYGPQVYGYVQRDTDKAPRCHNAKISAVGVEALDKGKAKERAEAAWAEVVRAKVAGRFMQISNAEGVVYECWKSSTGNRASEKAAEEFGRELHQCSVEGVPCRSTQEVADNDDPTTDQAIRRLRALGYDIKLIEPANPDEPKKPRIIRRFFPRKE